MKPGVHAHLALALVIALTAPAFAQQQATSPEARLKALGLQLPPPPKPIASYVPAVRTGNLIFLAGQGPVVDGKATITGKVGAEVTEEAANKAARATILTQLSVLRAEIGSLDRVRRIVKVVGFVNSAPGFTRQPWVMNGASDLLATRSKCRIHRRLGEYGFYAGAACGAPPRGEATTRYWMKVHVSCTVRRHHGSRHRAPEPAVGADLRHPDPGLSAVPELPGGDLPDRLGPAGVRLDSLGALCAASRRGRTRISAPV